MPYVYLLQPKEFIGTNGYKIGISSKEDLNRLQSYGRGTEYIQFFKCDEYMSAEKELIKTLNDSENFKLVKGREYFAGDREEIINIFSDIMKKYISKRSNSSKNNTNEKIDIQKNVKQINYDKYYKNSNINSTKKCEACNYSSRDKYDFSKHIKTKKHLDNLKSKNACSVCFKIYSNIGNKNRHEENCKNNIVQNSKVIINNFVSNYNNFNDNKSENIQNKQEKYYIMEISEMIKQSVKDYVAKEMNRQLLYEKCDFVDYYLKFEEIIRLNYFSKFIDINNCKDCIFENDLITYACNNHRLDYNEVIILMVQVLTSDERKNVCITSLKKYDNDDGQILIKHKNAFYNLDVLNLFLETFEYKFIIETKEESDIDQNIVLHLYKDFYSKFEANVKYNRYKYNRI